LVRWGTLGKSGPKNGAKCLGTKTWEHTSSKSPPTTGTKKCLVRRISKGPKKKQKQPTPGGKKNATLEKTTGPGKVLQGEVGLAVKRLRPVKTSTRSNRSSPTKIGKNDLGGQRSLNCPKYSKTET